MKIIADENISLVHEVFGEVGIVETFSGRSINAEHVKDADVLLVRSVTQVNEKLLRGSNVKFVGTCTAGADHIDQVYLAQQGINFSSAPGCNANAVVDYVISTLVVLSRGSEEKPAFNLFDRCVGIIGVGNVGKRLMHRLQLMGIRCVCTDPLYDDAQNLFDLVHIDEVLDEADIISLHVPLTETGAYPTYHLFNTNNLSQLKPDTILINAARGAVIDNDALKVMLAKRLDVTAVLDVWEHEPEVDVDLLNCVTLASSHIAGYSLDGKIRGTQMIYQALCQAFDVLATLDVMSLVPPVLPVVLVGDNSQSVNEIVFDVVLSCYNVKCDDQSFRNVITKNNTNRVASFDSLRRHYPVRREFSVTQVQGTKNGSLQSKLRAVGLDV